jgi:proline iminopeptidase
LPQFFTLHLRSENLSFGASFPLQKVINEREASGCFGSREYQDTMMTYSKIHVCRLDPWSDCLNRTLEKLGYGLYEQMLGPSEFTVTGTLKDYKRVDHLKEITVLTLFTCGQFDEATPSIIAYYYCIIAYYYCIIAYYYGILPG